MAPFLFILIGVKEQKWAIQIRQQIPLDLSDSEQRALEGMFFAEADIKMYLATSPKQLAEHLNKYILQAYRMGAEERRQ